MDIGVQIALIGAGSAALVSLIGIIILVINNKSSKELAIIAANNSVELAKIAAKQYDISERVDKYHKEVDGKMGQLLAAKKSQGIEEGKATQKADSTSTANETVEAIKADPGINVTKSK